MIKGIIALFKSGILLNPMVFSGVVLGFVFAIKFPLELIFTIYGDFRVYLVVLLFSFVYNFLFKKVYKRGGYVVDFKETFGNVILSAVYFFIANAMTISFTYMFTIF